MTGTVSGVLFPGEIYTLKEIQAKYPDVKSCTFLTLKETWDK